MTGKKILLVDDDDALDLSEEVEPEPAPEPEPVPASPPAPIEGIEMLDDEPEPGIVAPTTEVAGASAFGELASLIAGRMQLGQGRTVEALVQELLRPMLAEWLDQNLPDMVEELVEKEIQRMVEKADR